jgi:hypothetical protein
VRNNSNQLHIHYFQAYLFLQFTSERVFRLLATLYKSARNAPSKTRPENVIQQQDSILIINDNRRNRHRKAILDALNDPSSQSFWEFPPYIAKQVF